MSVNSGNLNSLKNFVMFTKNRKIIDNIMINVIVSFYNQLLSFCDIKYGNENQFIQNELNKSDIRKNLESYNKFIINSNTNTNAYSNANIENRVSDTISAFKDAKNLVEITDISNLFINIYVKIYLATIMNKKNFLSIQNINVPPELKDLLKGLMSNKNKSLPSLTNNTNTNIDSITSEIKGVYEFNTNITKYEKELRKIFNNVQTTKYVNSLSESDLSKYKDILTSNLKSEYNKFVKYYNKLNVLLNTNHIYNKKQLYNIITTYLNFINYFYKYIMTNYEYHYFISNSKST